MEAEAAHELAHLFGVPVERVERIRTCEEDAVKVYSLIDIVLLVTGIQCSKDAGKTLSRKLRDFPEVAAKCRHFKDMQEPHHAPLQKCESLVWGEHPRN